MELDLLPCSPQVDLPTAGTGRRSSVGLEMGEGRVCVPPSGSDQFDSDGVPSPGSMGLGPGSLSVVQVTHGLPVAYPPKIPDYVGCSILATMFCFLPLGIAALVYSMKVMKRIDEGSVLDIVCTDFSKAFDWFCM
eukprot:g26266.t1